MRHCLSKLVRVGLALALVAMMAPVVALADEGEFFEVDGLYYLYTGASEGVQLVGADPEVVGAEDGICIVPASVEYEGKTLLVMSVKHNQTTYNPAPNASDGGAFVNCTKLVDLRFECLSATASSLYCSAGFSIFKGCDNLEVVHFLGNGGTAEIGAAALADLKVIIHQGCGTTSTTSMSSAGSYQASGEADVYYSVLFETASGEQTEVFVSANATVSMLSALTSNVVYTDSELYGSAGIAPNACAPDLAANSSWVFVTEDGEQLGVNDTISACGTASEISLLDFTSASLYVTTSSFVYDGVAGKDPGAYVLDANGNTVDAANYQLTYYTSAGEAIALDDIKDVGTYTVRATGVGSYTGTCEATFTIAFEESTWTRVVSSVTNTLNLRHYISSQARLSTSYFANADGDTINTAAVIVVNPDDYASCAVACGLAGIFNCGIITVDEDCIRASNGKLTATNVTNYASVLAKNLAIVLGTSDYISEELYDAVVTTVTSAGKVTRLETDAATSTAQIAELAYSMMEACAAGEFSLGASFESFEGAMVVPSSGSASVFTALAWANAHNQAVFFATSDGRVSTKTVQYLANFDTVVAAGFEEAAVESIAASLPEGCALEDWGIEADECATAISYATKAAADGTNLWSNSLSVCGVGDYGVLACVSASCGFAGSAMVLSGTAQGAESTLTSFVSEHTYEIATGYIFGTYADVSAQTQVALQAMRMELDINDLNFASVEAITEYAYTGEAVTPECTVTLADGTQVSEGDDYILYYYKANTCEYLCSTIIDDYWASGANVTSVKIVVGSVSKMVEEGTYTVLVQGTFIQHVNSQPSTSGTGLYTGTTGTCTGFTAFTITIGEADEALDYTSAYVEVIDESDYPQAEEEPTPGDDEGEGEDLSGTDPEGSDAGSDSSEGTDASAGDSGSAGSEAESQGAAETLAAQKISVKAAAKTLKVKKLKKKAVTCKFKVTGAHTTLVAKAANKKSKKALKVKVSGKTVKVTVARGTKKGTYKVKVYAKASGGYAKSAAKTISIKVK